MSILKKSAETIKRAAASVRYNLVVLAGPDELTY
jgi:hypothetical protein